MAGFKCYADFEMVLSHVGKTVFRSSLGHTLRRVNNDTIAHVIKQIKEGKETIDTLEELHEAIGTNWSMNVNGLTTLMLMARKADGPIIETGSGLSTLVMAAANPDQIVYCLEHDPAYAKKLRGWASAAGLKNIGLCVCPLKDGWYDLDEMDLPKQFALGLNDGPPRAEGHRRGFFSEFAGRIDTMVIDDAEEPTYRNYLNSWALERDLQIEFLGRLGFIKQSTAVC